MSSVYGVKFNGYKNSVRFSFANLEQEGVALKETEKADRDLRIL